MMYCRMSGRHGPHVNYVSVSVVCRNQFDAGVPFGGYKQSGIGREKGQSAMEHYTQVGKDVPCPGLMML